ncbi:MAG TPA: tetratricopeptide repeat protein [Acidobacteriaceae bacterium]|jgi:tetratricopeptide (TPR) repeat protein
MAILTSKYPLSVEERRERRRLILSDTLSLTTLFAITLALAFVTNRFYQSYASHQAELANRWRVRGEAALKAGHAQAAIVALRSALAYAPGERKIEIELAEALASAGRIPEATSYFNTLSESEPGSGIINLQLARLAARQNDVRQALEHYHRAIYGDWEGDGYVRRRQVRMEMINFLIAKHLDDEARTELLVAAGNAPEQDLQFHIEVAQAMEQAHDFVDALRTYRKILQHNPSSLAAAVGAGRTAFQLGRYAEARQYLERAVNNPSMAGQPVEVSRTARDLLRDVTRLLLLYPSPELRAKARSARILEDRQIALARLQSCLARQGTTPENSQKVVAAAPAAGKRESGSVSIPRALQGSLQSLESTFQHHPQKAEADNAPKPAQGAAGLADVLARWNEQPEKITLSRLESDPDLAQSIIQLIYDTERVTAQVCGPPGGDDALLLKIAQAPNAVEQE